MRKILIDIYHLPQFNFFKNAILSFQPEEIDIYCVNRGKLYKVMQHELPGYEVNCIGDYKHNKGMLSMITKIIIPRMLKLFQAARKNKYKFIVTAHYQANVIGKILGIPNIAFNDDPRRFVFPVLKLSADKVYLPPFSGEYPGVNTFNSLKEWAYLSPNYLQPNSRVLDYYKVDPKSYIFIREVSTKTSNYLDQQQDTILSIADQFPSDIPVLLSLENKENRDKYPNSWTILEEPVEDIHSLMYYSGLVISSGDSVAREGAMLGVPAIYGGIRDMPANQILIEKGMLAKIEPNNIVDYSLKVLNGEIEFLGQEAFRQIIFEEWDDVTELILNQINQSTIKIK